MKKLQWEFEEEAADRGDAICCATAEWAQHEKREWRSWTAGRRRKEGRKGWKDGRMDERVDGQMNGGKDKWSGNEREQLLSYSWPPSLSPPSLTPSLSHSRPANLETTTTAFHWLWHPGASGGWGSVGQRGSWPGMDVGLVSSQQGATKKEPLLLVQK